MERTVRSHALDWLRIGGTAAVLLFHSARFFDGGDWHVKNPTVDPYLDVFATALIQWLMPLFFVLSGAAACIALQRQSAGKFAASKVTRLLVPVLFGVLVLAPPQVYLERLTHHQYTEGLLAWLPQYFDGWYGFGGNFAWMGMHLWYLLILFVWSMLTLPLCLALKNGTAQKVAGFLARPGMVFLLIIPMLLLELVMHPDSILAVKSMGGWSPLIYGIFYLFGFLDAANVATLPFYMLHQTVLLVLGYFVVQWQWPNLAKFAFIAITATAVILTIYFLLIKPFRVTRYLFGMKTRQDDTGRRSAA